MSNSIEMSILFSEIVLGSFSVAIAVWHGKNSLATPLSITKGEKGFSVDVNGWAALLLLGFVLILAPSYHLHENRAEDLRSATSKLEDCKSNCLDCAKRIRDLDQFEIRLRPNLSTSNSTELAPNPSTLNYHVYVRIDPNAPPHEVPIAGCDRSIPVSVRVTGLHVNEAPQIKLEAVDPVTGRYWTSAEAPAASYEVTLSYDKSQHTQLASLSH
jgi:hypothetical protein